MKDIHVAASNKDCVKRLLCIYRKGTSFGSFILYFIVKHFNVCKIASEPSTYVYTLLV